MAIPGLRLGFAGPCCILCWPHLPGCGPWFCGFSLVAESAFGMLSHLDGIAVDSRMWIPSLYKERWLRVFGWHFDLLDHAADVWDFGRPRMNYCRCNLADDGVLISRGMSKLGLRCCIGTGALSGSTNDEPANVASSFDYPGLDVGTQVVDDLVADYPHWQHTNLLVPLVLATQLWAPRIQGRSSATLRSLLAVHTALLMRICLGFILSAEADATALFGTALDCNDELLCSFLDVTLVASLTMRWLMEVEWLESQGHSQVAFAGAEMVLRTDACCF
ncbi:hypothetical protein Nepgr_005290 [Nepenthes gracilis]|uniref:Uncharacterized protein n=1 Tax=Nepenthes gracilis TaxID=150966 RepID=A0AAD3XGG4_NEPGR|nr:hypothetical protein Nepgr_005290 [Nepenthes gracilis]